MRPRSRFRSSTGRFRRSRRAQVSAVATVLGLLLVVLFISTYVLLPLPNQMKGLEDQHNLELQDQISRLQATLFAQVRNGGAGLPLSSPVTLGSSADPPFGQGASGLLSQTLYPSHTSLTVDEALSTPPAWGAGNLCSTSTSTSCSSSASNVCSPPESYNLSVNNTAYTFDLTGSNDCVRVNATGSGDTFTLEMSGSNLGYFIFDLFGFNDTVELNNHFSGSNFHAFFNLYGGYDTYKATGGPTGSGLFLNTTFISQGHTPGTCADGNYSSTDKWSIGTSSASNSVQNLTWWNAQDYSTAYKVTNGWPGSGNSGTGDHVGWENETGITSCAFVTLQQTLLSSTWGGVAVQANNIYSPPATIALDSGAVLLSSGAGSTMISQPDWRVTVGSGGVRALSLVLLNFENVQNTTTVSGWETATVSTSLRGETTSTLTTNDVTVSVITAYPQGWITWLRSPAGNAEDVTCSGSAADCITPPTGTLETVSATYDVASVSVLWATVAITFG